MKLFDLFATISLDSSKFTSGLGTAQKNMTAFANNCNAAVNKTQNIVKTALQVVGVAAAAKFVKSLASIGNSYNQKMEDYTTNFTTMLGSAELAADKVEELATMAASTPFTMSDLADGTQTLLAFGVASEESTGILKSLGDIALGDSQKMQTLTRAYGKMSSTQKISLENVQMMIDAGFNPLQLIAEKTGLTMEDMYDAVSKGAVPFSELEWAIQQATSEGGQFYNGMLNASQTMSGRISTLEDNWNSFLGSLFEPVTNFIKDSVLPWAIDSVETLTTALGENGLQGAFTAFLDILKGTGTSILDSIKDYFNSEDASAKTTEAMTTLATNLNSTSSTAFSLTALAGTVMDSLNTAMSDSKVLDSAGNVAQSIINGVLTFKTEKLNILTKINTFVGGLVSAIADGMKKAVDGGTLDVYFRTILDSMVTNIATMAKVAGNVADIAKNLITGIKNFVTSEDGAESIKSFATSLITGIGSTITELLGSLPDIISACSEVVSSIFDSLSSALTETGEDGKTPAAGIANKIVGGIAEALTSLVSNIPGLVDSAITLVTSLVTAMTDALTGEEATTKWGTFGTTLANSIDTAISSLVDNLPSLLTFVNKLITKLGEDIGNAIGSFLSSGISEGFENGFSTENGEGFKLNPEKADVLSFLDALGFEGLVQDIENFDKACNEAREAAVTGLGNALTWYEEKSAALGNWFLNLPESIVNVFNTAVDASSSALGKAVEWLSSKFSSIGSWVNEIIQDMNNFFNLGSTNSPIVKAINAVSDAIGSVISWAQSGIDTIKEFLGLGGGDDEETTNTGTTVGEWQGPMPQFATGLYNVPNDGFRAVLHEGEAVLTKAQANEWRKGYGTQSGSSFNPTINIQTTADTPQETALLVKQALRRARFA